MIRKILVVVILLLLNLVALSGAYMNRQRMSARPQALSAAVPDFSWQEFDGKAHAIKELSGHPVVIHFWATWCGPCRKELPELLETAKTLGSTVTFLTISGDEDKEKTEKYIRQLQERTGTEHLKNVVYAFDPEKKISLDIFQTAAYPESILVDGTGQMRRKFVGAANWNDEETLGYLKSLK